MSNTRNMSNEDAMAQQAAEQFAQNMAKYPIEEQIAVGLVSKNILNGCSWEFVRNNQDVRRNEVAFKKSEHCNLIKNKTGYIVTIAFKRILEILAKEGMGIFNKKDLEIASKHREAAFISLDKKMKKGYNGKIGIFCTNDSTSITINGTTYPAYAVTLQEMLSLCARNNYGCVMGGIRTANEVAAKHDQVMQILDLAPSGNALLIEIQKL